MHRRATRLTGILTAAAIAATAALASAPARASEPFLGQIQMVGFGFAPRGWATCDGQLLAISQNTALFSLLGTTFGGDGRTTFSLPDLRGRTALHVGTGPGLTSVTWGQRGGAENHTLTVGQMPSHSHAARAYGPAGNSDSPDGNVWSRRGRINVYSTNAPDVDMHSASIGNTGSNQSFSIRNPYLGIYHVIALQGIFPSRN